MFSYTSEETTLSEGIWIVSDFSNIFLFSQERLLGRLQGRPQPGLAYFCATAELECMQPPGPYLQPTTPSAWVPVELSCSNGCEKLGKVECALWINSELLNECFQQIRTSFLCSQFFLFKLFFFLCLCCGFQPLQLERQRCHFQTFKVLKSINGEDCLVCLWSAQKDKSCLSWM